MSMGYGGACRKFFVDTEFVIYEYFSYDLSFSRLEKNFDGFIVIRKNILIDPELYEKVINVQIEELISAGNVQIKNCSNTWKTLSNGVDFIAYKLCRKIFLIYQREGILPEKCNFES